MIHRTEAQSFALTISLLSALALQGCQTRPRPADERPAEITLPMAGERTDLDAFRSRLAGFSRGPLHTRTRRAVCAGTRGCVAEVTIQAVGRSTDIHSARGPKPGRIVGHIRNLDPEHTTEMFSLRPSTQAEYYLYIDADPSGAARWNLLEVPVGPSGTIRRMVQENVAQCPGIPEHEAPAYSDVDFLRCGQHEASRSGYKRAGILGNGGFAGLLSRITSSFRTASPSASAYEAGKWYWCPTGCCT
jgi:hypothetical protein